MRILIISSFPAPYRVEVFKEINKDYDVDLFFETAKDQNRNVEWFTKNSEIPFYILDNQFSKKKYKQALANIRNYDAVLAYDFYLKSAMRAQLMCILHKVPYFINCDGAFINRSLLKRIIKSFFISRASGCFASGEAAKKYFLYYGAKEDNIYKHNFTSLHNEDILHTPISLEEKTSIREELEIENKKTVITVGQFIYRKGFDVLLRVWDKISGDYQLIIIGGGALEANYKEYIRKNDIKNVKIIGFQPKEQIFKYYKASDLFILPTREDIWGLVVNEAMACGLPVITTEMCIAGRELINDELNGFIVPADDVNALLDKILKILENKNLSKQIMINNIKKIQGNTIENIGKDHVKVLNQFFSKHSKG